MKVRGRKPKIDIENRPLLAQRLREARLRKGFTQLKLADTLQLSQSSIGDYETGAASPSVDLIMTISEVLDVDFGWLAGAESSRQINSLIQRDTYRFDLEWKDNRTYDPEFNDFLYKLERILVECNKKFTPRELALMARTVWSGVMNVTANIPLLDKVDLQLTQLKITLEQIKEFGLDHVHPSSK